MFIDVLDKVSGLLDRRFLLNAFLPVLIFWGLLFLVVGFGTGYLDQIVALWDAQPNLIKAIQIVAGVAGVTVCAQILVSQSTNLLYLYEGYWRSEHWWGWLGWWLQSQGQSWHIARIRSLTRRISAAQADEQQQDYYQRSKDRLHHLFYPPETRPEAIMPTRIGNILKAAEMYPYLRYGMDSACLWPRLYQVMPLHITATIENVRGSIEFMIEITSLSTTFAIVSGICLLYIGASWWLFLISFWGGMLVAWFAYQGAIGHALSYAEQIKVAFDLYRFDLLKALHLPEPTTRKEERSLWKNTGQLIYRNITAEPLRYAHPAKGPDTTAP